MKDKVTLLKTESLDLVFNCMEREKKISTLLKDFFSIEKNFFKSLVLILSFFVINVSYA